MKTKRKKLEAWRWKEKKKKTKWGQEEIMIVKKDILYKLLLEKNFFLEELQPYSILRDINHWMSGSKFFRETSLRI